MYLHLAPLHHGRPSSALASLWRTGPCHTLGRAAGIRRAAWHSLCHEREEVARVRVLLAKDQPALALQRLEPVLQRATTGQRWGHVIEMRLLQALAYQMLQEETQALDALSEAVRLGEPEGYIRSLSTKELRWRLCSISCEAQPETGTNSLSGHAACCLSAGEQGHAQEEDVKA